MTAESATSPAAPWRCPRATARPVSASKSASALPLTRGPSPWPQSTSSDVDPSPWRTPLGTRLRRAGRSGRSTTSAGAHWGSDGSAERPGDVEAVHQHVGEGCLGSGAGRGEPCVGLAAQELDDLVEESRRLLSGQRGSPGRSSRGKPAWPPRTSVCSPRGAGPGAQPRRARSTRCTGSELNAARGEPGQQVGHSATLLGNLSERVHAGILPVTRRCVRVLVGVSPGGRRAQRGRLGPR